jgi:hypothetical protein
MQADHKLYFLGAIEQEVDDARVHLPVMAA